MYRSAELAKMLNLKCIRAMIAWATVVMLLTSCRGDPDVSQNVTTAGTESIEEATILLESSTSGSWPSGLDPATNATSGLNFTLMNAIFGGLFQLSADDNGRNPRIIGVLASSYEVSDEGKSLIIRLREGLKFSDGTPLNAEAVRFNVARALETPCSCAPLRFPWAESQPVTVLDDLTIVLNFNRPYPRAINSMPVVNINWIASPTALGEMGPEAFKIKPVGAGPFKIVSNQISSELALERNPEYWQPDRPYLDRLTFKSVASNQAAYLALLAGDADAAEGITSPLLIEEALTNENIVVTRPPSTATYVIQLNTLAPPFDNVLARQAIYFATDVDTILSGLFKGQYFSSQSFTGPGGLYHKEKIPGYRTHDLEKARAIVNQLGGIKVTLATIQSPVAEQLITALQSQWREAGIEASIEKVEIGNLISQLQNRKWQALLQTVGSYDPDASNGVKVRFGSGQLFSGVADERLDNLLLEASSSESPEQENYFRAAQHISDQAYAPFLFSFAPTQLTTNGLQGPGLTTPIPPISGNSSILWQDVRFIAK